MEWNITISAEGAAEMINLPRTVQNQIWKKVVPDLQAHGPRVVGSKLKAITQKSQKKRPRGLFRYRVGDYRILLRVLAHDRRIDLLCVDHRKTIYNRNTWEDAENSPRIATRPRWLGESPPATSTSATSEGFLANEAGADSLPLRIDQALLQRVLVPEAFWADYLAVETEDDFLRLDQLPEAARHESVLEALYPEVRRVPKWVATAEDLKRLVEGDISLEGLMLVLDPDQQQFLDRIQGPHPEGPWLVKGGPGTGKSLLALYALRRLAEVLAERPDKAPPARILFTTYTNALTESARHLLTTLGLHQKAVDLTIENTDKVIGRYLPTDETIWTTAQFAQKTIGRVLDISRARDGNYPFASDDSAFIYAEIEKVILGLGLRSKDSYLSQQRHGRGRPLGQRQREAIWEVFTETSRRLQASGRRLWGERALEAQWNVRQEFDYVFIDEAQDLTLAMLRAVVGTCKTRSGIFITADSNQSIYGNGMPWREVAEDLRFAGRTRVFQRNFRNPKPLWEAIAPLANNLPNRDSDTLPEDAIASGSRPLLVRFQGSEASAVARTITVLCEREGLDFPNCVVLVKSHRVAHELSRALPRKMKAKAMKSTTFSLSYPGVKVTTLHSAKGLEFPLVVVAGLADEILPGAIIDDADLDRAQRLLFVGASRATKQLALVAPTSGACRFLDFLDESQWETE